MNTEVEIPRRDYVDAALKELSRIVIQSLDEMIADPDSPEHTTQFAPIYIHVMRMDEPDEDGDQFNTVVFDETCFGMPEDSMPPNMLLELFKKISTKARKEPNSVFKAQDETTGEMVEDGYEFFGTLVHSGGTMLKINTETDERETHEVMMLQLETVDGVSAMLVWKMELVNNKVVGYEPMETEIQMLSKGMNGQGQNTLGFEPHELPDDDINHDEIAKVH